MSIMKLIPVGVSALAGLYLLVHFSSGFALVAAFVMVAGSVWYAEHQTANHILPFDRGVLITGCDTGFGFELVHQLDALGMTVFAGCLNKDSEGAEKLRANMEQTHVIQMDVTKDEEVAKAVEYVEANMPRKGFMGLINNAGLNHIGDLECTPMEHFEKVSAVNTLGTIRVTKAFLPLIRKYQGRIINVTSVQGLMPIPYLGPYNITKHAGEAFADILRMEMHKWGVKVSIIEPGHFGGATGCIEMNRLTKDFNDMWEKASPDVKDAYGKDYIVDGHTNAAVGGRESSSYNINPVMEAMMEALLAEKPKYRYKVGGSKHVMDPYMLLAHLYPFLPTAISDRLLIWFTRFPKTPAGLLPANQEPETESEDEIDASEPEE